MRKTISSCLLFNRGWAWGLTLGAIAAIALMWGLGVFIAKMHARKQFESYACIPLSPDDHIISYESTVNVLDGGYVAVVGLSDASVQSLKAAPPPWASGPWRLGRRINLAEQLSIPPTKSLISVIGTQDNSIHRIMSIDCKSKLLYFEMKIY